MHQRINIISYFILTWFKIIDCRSLVTLKDNGYKDLVIAIDPNVPENLSLIKKIQEIWTEASRDLFVATEYQIYFSEVIILVPRTWSNVEYPTSLYAVHHKADVSVVNFNSLITNRPWTKNYGYCGQRGERIYMTPDYILNKMFGKIFGSRGKTIVHEWAHYRWGVFDEFPTEDDATFYRHQNVWEATRCPQNLRGIFKASFNFDSGRTSACRFDAQKETRHPCYFVPFSDGIQDTFVSLMSHHFLDEVKHFCSSANHNIEAPNEQNRLCNLRSSWEVLKTSPDFAQLKQLDTATNTTPKFSIVKERSQRIVFVIDQSVSILRHNRFRILKQVLYLCMSFYVANGVGVGLVSFSNNATVLSDIVQLDSTADRNTMIEKIPRNLNFYAAQGTCIGCGVDRAIQILEKSGSTAAGANVIVLTDGEENRHPLILEIASIVKSKKVFLHTIFFATNGNQDLIELIKQTGGEWYFSGNQFTLSAFENFFTIVTRQEGCDDIVLLKSVSGEIPPESKRSYDVFVDVFAGSQTRFSLSFDKYLPSTRIAILTPSGCDCTIHANSCVNCIKNESSDFETVTFEVPGLAMVGRWNVNVTVGVESRSLILLVTSKNRPSKSAGRSCLSLTPRTKVTKVETSTPIVIFAELCQNQIPVLNTTVTAIIEMPDGRTRTKRLYDKGAAPDVVKNDGVYSRYYFEYSGNGRYSITIRASSEGLKEGVSTERVCGASANIDIGRAQSSSGRIVLNKEAKFYFNVSRISTAEPFERVARLHGFEYSGSPYSIQNDIHPPSGIIDLRARQTATNQIMLTFSAPGADQDVGVATSYDFRYVIDDLTKLRDDFESCPVLNVSLIFNFTKPAMAGVVESLVFDAPEFGNKSYALYGFSLRSRDEKGNVASPSNVAVVTFSLSTLYLALGNFALEAKADDTLAPIFIAGNSIAGFILVCITILGYLFAREIKNKKGKVYEMQNNIDHSDAYRSEYKHRVSQELRKDDDNHFSPTKEQPVNVRQSLYAIQSDYDNPPIYDKQSAYDRHSVYDKQSVYDTHSVHDKQSVYDKDFIHDKQSEYDKQSVNEQPIYEQTEAKQVLDKERPVINVEVLSVTKDPIVDNRTWRKQRMPHRY